ncbi:hypothetical protein [Streptomyces sp. NPDC051776]|uniref:hypothetical protein n=1 Tax=Streptomyces sp. NPDC051776 TaxID=3155414 RepID=UPI00341BD973
MMTNGKIAVALVGGYLLGRTRKAKLALALGLFLAGKKLSLDPQQLGKLVANSPVLSGLSNQARQQLVDATKSAATTALTNRANSLAESLHERTLSLRDIGTGTRGGDEVDHDAQDEVQADDDAAPEDERGGERGKTRRAASEEEPSRERESAPRGKTTASSRSRKGTTPSTRRKTAAGGTRKAASGTRRTASSPARKTATKTVGKTAKKTVGKTAGARGSRNE